MDVLTDILVCEICRKIDFQDLLQNPRNKSYLNDPPGSMRYLIQYNKDCLICQMLLRPTDKIQEVRSFTTFENCHWINRTLPNAQDGVMLIVGEPYTYFRIDDMLDYIFCTDSNDHTEGLFKPRPVQELWNGNAAKLWLQSCQEYHGEDCNPRSGISVTGMNLIDCDNMVIVKAPPSSHWIALSYVWGAAPPNSNTNVRSSFHSGSILPSNLPSTIQDAISVTRSLGYRYLWVDEFCIDQSDSNSRRDQIGQMDQIYRGADLTIVAAAGHNKHYGLPGVSTTKRSNIDVTIVDGVSIFSSGTNPIHSIHMSRWFSRAWTFQEGVLSRRLLVFTDHQMSFYCKSSSWMEGLGGPEHLSQASLASKITPVVSLFYPGQNSSAEKRDLEDWEYLQELVEGYASRHLTFEGDTLNACLGVLTDLRRTRPTAYTLCGLPFVRDDRDGELASLESAVSTALSWYPPDSYRRKGMFPSWTWAGWHGSICFQHIQEKDVTWKPILRQVQLETTDCEVLHASSIPDWSHCIDVQNTLDTISGIHFEAPMLSGNHIMKVPGKEEDIFPWEDFVIAERTFQREPRWVVPKPEVLCALRDNVRSGVWSCFILGFQSDQREWEDSCNRFVLVVGWGEDQVTAERIAGFVLSSDKQSEKDLGALEDGLQWRKVRLV